MAGNVGSVAIYLLPGMKAKLAVPDFFVGTGDKKYMKSNGEVVEMRLTQGFFVEDEDVGTIEAVPGEPAVIYTHKKYAQNKIVYTARTGERGEVHVIAVPIHDHASIVTGGPAYGTYFTDDETIGES
jgi:hypothetical protein